MKKQMLAIGCAVAILFMFSVSNVFSWGSATHAYIGNKLGSKGGLKDFDEMYGALAPDVFNYTFESYYLYLYAQTHYTTFNLNAVADKKLQKALAYGYFSHNGLWGADVTAHSHGVTVGQNEGYVIAKANLMVPFIDGLLQHNGVFLESTVLAEVCHNFVEASVDILMTRIDPGIGQKLVKAGLFRSCAFPAMLLDVYAQGLTEPPWNMSFEEATQVITEAEKNFRKITILYGLALTEPEDIAVSLLADNFASLAPAFLAAMGVSVPQGLDFAALATLGIQQGISMCENDFAAEVNATYKMVKKNMVEHKKDK